MLFTDLCLLIALSYLIIAIKRLLGTRINHHYKYTSFARTAVVILVFSLCVFITESLTEWFSLGYQFVLLMAALLQMVAILIIWYSFLVHKKHGKAIIPSQLPKNLPSVSVCIPARNESEELSKCLDLLLASKYPKLEILVYDDSSQPKATPQNKKMYANSGVKFVNGSLPSDKWLAKNYAYQRLLDESNGDILLFCGVDTRFSQETLSNIIKIMSDGTTMLSVLPRNVFSEAPGWKKYLVQPTRYAWEIGLPRWLVNRPAILSTCWVIQRKAIDSFGNFEAVSRKVVPESYFARQCFAHNLKYQFLYADDVLKLENIKLLDEQRSTAIRTRYPQLHRRVENVMLMSLLISFVFLGPYAGIMLSLFNSLYAVTALSIICVVLGLFVYSQIVGLTYRKPMPLALIMGPVAAVYDIWMLNYSMWQYEFGTVSWKGRNITDPVINRTNHKRWSL